MSNDHFVAQTYLKLFVDASHRNMLHAYRKSDGLYFPCRTKDICHEWDGDKTPMLSNPALLGDFRKIFEPAWRASVETILTKMFSPSDKFNISGYFANLMTCTPAWQRLARSMYNDHAANFRFSSRGSILNTEMTQNSLRRLLTCLKSGALELDHDPDFIKATIAKNLLDFAWASYNEDWTIITNETEYPFITSDNPVALYQPNDIRQAVTRYLSITPKLGLSITYRRKRYSPFKPGLPPEGVIRWAHATSQGAKYVNRLIVQCAEDLVFSSRKSVGVEALTRASTRVLALM